MRRRCNDLHGCAAARRAGHRCGFESAGPGFSECGRHGRAGEAGRIARNACGEDVTIYMVVRLPGERVIVVDSKVPDLDFLSAADTAEPAKRGELLATHAAKLQPC